MTRSSPVDDDVKVTTVRVETKAGAFSYVCGPGETLLAAGLAAGFNLPYECTTGTCGTCRGRVTEGEVDPGWPDAPALRKFRPDKGDVLMCQARAAGDCLIKVPANAVQPDPVVPRMLRRTGRVDVVQRLTRDVAHFEVALSQPITFDAGQFVSVGHPTLEGRRAYSMVNYGSDLDRLSFVVKRKPDGGFSNFLFDGAFLGADLDIFGPLGRATFREGDDRDIVLIAGGSGIAGMMAILDRATGINYFKSHKGHVFFGVRTLVDAFYLQAFADHVAAANGGLAVTIAISDEPDMPEVHPDHAGVRMECGMVHAVAAAAMAAGDWREAIAFVAGPQPMVDAALRSLIGEAGLSAANIRFDKFS